MVTQVEEVENDPETELKEHQEGTLKKKVKKCFKSRYFQTLSCFIVVNVYLFTFTIITILSHTWRAANFIDANIVIRHIEKSLQESLKYDKGMGCEIPQFDPFSNEIMAFNKDFPKVTCGTGDWVKCYLSECKAVEQILNSTTDLKCYYKDILYVNYIHYKLGSATVVEGDGVYYLEKSDHVQIHCTGKLKNNFSSAQWTGHGAGYRKKVYLKSPPAGREGSVDVLIFGFDSTSKNGLIRKMPKTYEYLKNELGVTFLNGYTILGDGTKAALFPLLSGKHELEFPDARRNAKVKKYLNENEFIFKQLKNYGYRTALFEDTPTSTFHHRYNGFNYQPADHYLTFYIKADDEFHLSKQLCIGDTPLHNVLMNLTDQFFKLPGKHFIFTFMIQISHDEFNQISAADDDTVNFLKNLKRQGIFDNTMLLFMGDHGVRYSKVRQTIQGKYEERLPLMSILLPKVLKERRPKIQAILENNTNVLTTAHDIYTTVLDALDLMHLRNTYRIRGADMDRGLTLFEPIPSNRSCSTAGIESHWCVCVSWDNVTHTDVLYQRSANAFVDYVNSLTEKFRSLCAPRTLSHISWVMKQRVNNKLMAFVTSVDNDDLMGEFNKNVDIDRVFLQIKVTLGPSEGVFEASTTYLKKEDKFIFNTREISRTSMYRNEPNCISETNPELNFFCFCRKLDRDAPCDKVRRTRDLQEDALMPHLVERFVNLFVKEKTEK